MPLVFVHGVNVRRGETYERELAFRNRHFIEIFYKQLGRNIEADSIFNPYWGDLGATVSPDTPFLPRGRYEMLWHRNTGKSANDNHKHRAEIASDPDNLPAPNILNGETEIQERGDLENPLLYMARQASLDEAIDILFELAEQEMIECGTESSHSYDDMAMLAQKALAFSHSPEGERWLSSLTSDEQLVEGLADFLAEHSGKSGKGSSRIRGIVRAARSRLGHLLAGTKRTLSEGSKSFASRLKEDVQAMRLRFRQGAAGTTARLLNDPVRQLFHKQCALLIGDAFSYFSERGDEGKPSPIAERVIESLKQAEKLKKDTGEDLIVIGHSMGGVIMCDIATCYGRDIPIDILITVGSQFPLFADLRMFPGIKSSSMPIARPANLRRWINIFSPHDFLGYPASHIFDGVDDYHLPSYAVGASAHADYFNRRSFYFQLARRISDYLPAPAQ